MTLKMICPDDLPGPVQSVVKTITDAGYQAYLVGGCVRDLLLGREPKDYDVATSALPEQVAALFPKVIPTGIQYGTVTVLHGDMSIEVTTFRGDGNYSDGRRPDSVKFARTIEEDLGRRDFTVNAMAFGLERGLIDPFGGHFDLKEKTITAVGDPLARFTEDALRMLRAIRFTATLGFELAPGLAGSIYSRSFMLENVAQERIREELNRILLSPAPERGLRLLSKTGLLEQFLPELQRCCGFDQRNPHHAFDVFTHTAHVVYEIPPALPLRLAGLLHDIGKPGTFTQMDGVGHFYGHDDLGAQMARTILERLKYDRETIGRVVHLVQHHMFADNMTTKGIRRWIARVGADTVPDLLELRLADMKGSGTPHDTSHVERIRAVLEEMQAEGVAEPVSALAVNGHDVMETLGIKPGPEVGLTLKRLTEHIVDFPELNHRATLLGILRSGVLASI